MSDADRVRVLSRVSDVWRRYIASKRRLISVTERCCLRGWPDRTSDIRTAFRLQALFCDVELLRFAHRITLWENPSDRTYPSLINLKVIARAIQQDWDDHTETTLQQIHPTYKALVQAIEDCQASMNPDALTDPFRDAQRNSEYGEARRAAQAELADFDRELARP